MQVKWLRTALQNHFTVHTELRALAQQLIHLVARNTVEEHVSTA
jgi:hypothetical protein